MRGQIYSKSGSKFIRLHAFSELSLLLSFYLGCPFASHPSPSIPYFCLFHTNTSGRTILVLLVCPSHIHMYANTQTQGRHRHGHKELLTECEVFVNRLNKCKHLTEKLINCSAECLTDFIKTREFQLKWFCAMAEHELGRFLILIGRF